MKHARFGLVLMSAALLTAAAPSSNSANATASAGFPDSKLILSVTQNDLAALVRAEGHKVDEMHPFDSPSVRGKTAKGLVYVLIGSACDKAAVPHCQGIMMQVRYDADDTVTAERVNAAALKEAALGVWWDHEGKTVGFTRYVVLDNGVTWLNIRRNLRVLLALQENTRAVVFD